MKKDSPHKLPLQVLKKFRLIYGSVRQHFRQVERVCGVPGSQLWLLKETLSTPGIGVSELAERLSIHQSTCSQHVDKLVARGLLKKQRSSEDQRRVGLVASKRAVDLLGLAPGPAEGLLPDALDALSPGTLRNLDEALTQLIVQLRQHDDKFADNPLADM